MTQPTGPFGFTGPRVAARRDAFLPDRCPVSPRRATGADQRDSLPSHGTPTSMTGPAVLPAARPAGRRAGGRWLAIVAASLLFHATLLDVLPHWSLAPTDDTAERHAAARHAGGAGRGGRAAARWCRSSRRRRDRRPGRVHASRPDPGRRSRSRRNSFPSPPKRCPRSRSRHPARRIAREPPLPRRSPSQRPRSPRPIHRPRRRPRPRRPQWQRRCRSRPGCATRCCTSTRRTSTRCTTTASARSTGRPATDAIAAASSPRSTSCCSRSTSWNRHSEGSVGPSGLAPDRYTEKPQRRPTVATNFNRDARQSITFSASPATAPLVAAARRTACRCCSRSARCCSPIRSRSSAGGHIDMPVAGVRGDVETWQLRDRSGSSRSTAGGTTLETTHLRTPPRPGSNDRDIDVWIARGRRLSGPRAVHRAERQHGR